MASLIFLQLCSVTLRGTIHISTLSAITTHKKTQNELLLNGNITYKIPATQLLRNKKPENSRERLSYCYRLLTKLEADIPFYDKSSHQSKNSSGRNCWSRNGHPDDGENQLDCRMHVIYGLWKWQIFFFPAEKGFFLTRTRVPKDEVFQIFTFRLLFCGCMSELCLVVPLTFEMTIPGWIQNHKPTLFKKETLQSAEKINWRSWS